MQHDTTDLQDQQIQYICLRRHSCDLLLWSERLLAEVLAATYAKLC